MPTYTRQFRLAYLSLAAVLILALGLTVKFSSEGRQKPAHGVSGGSTPHYAIDAKEWGHVRAYDGLLQFFLGPAADQRRRYEVGFGRALFTSVLVGVADREGGTIYRVHGEPEGPNGCLLHAQGYGLNVLIAIGRCVPAWATVTGDPKHGRAREWIRVENLINKPRVVYIKYA